MSTFVGEELPDALLARLSLERALEYADRGIVACTVDEHGWPHPAMMSSLELVARDRRNVRVAAAASSRTARNMTANGRLTLIVADEEAVYYVKGDVLPLSAGLAAARELASFNMRVDSVLADRPAEGEQARLTSGIRVRRHHVDATRARAVLDELLGG